MSQDHMSLLWPHEENFEIPLGDNYFANSKLMGGLTDHVVIYAHGLVSSLNRTLAFTLASFLHHHAFNVLRLNFYDGGKHNRRLLDSTLSQHAEDLDQVVDYVRQHGAKQITVIGHSFGGLATLLSLHQSFDQAILLDPSHPGCSPFDKADWNEKISSYQYHSHGIDHLVGRTMVEEFHNLNPTDYVPEFRKPTLMITAGDGPLLPYNTEYLSLFPNSASITQHVIEGASHIFDPPSARRELCEAVLSWLNKPEARA